MDQYKDLLVEVGTEELPPNALKTLSESFGAAVLRLLDENDVAHAAAELFATPRRLAVQVGAVALQQPDQELVRRGPSLAAAFDGTGAPTKAATGFARSCGVDVGELDREETGQGAWLVFRRREAGRKTADLLPALIEEALRALPIPKRMRWGAGDEEFVRPVHWVCLMLGAGRVPGRVLGVDTLSVTYGHRFHHPGALSLSAPAAYERILRESGHVEPGFAARRALIQSQVSALGQSLGGVARIDERLLDEVTALCEWPVGFVGGFDVGFLEMPAEVLIETMQKNQKYFPVFSEDGTLLPHFVGVSNIESLQPALVRAGNERVIRPRFSDARFFWEQDLKAPLDAHYARLADVTFQHQLGSLQDKAIRVGRVARDVAAMAGADPALVERSARLAKCDLLTQMVGEFAGLQGVMGRYYARHSAEDPCVAAAMEEQYLPRHAGDRLPESPCGRVLALIDRLDSLVGIFAIGQRPSGAKDPYGLRRAAIGALRILIETPLPLDLRELLAQVAKGYGDRVPASASVDDVFTYSMERLVGYYADQGIGADVVESVLGVDIGVPSDIDRRVRAVVAFRTLPEAAALAAANKRIRNILKKAGEHDPAQAVDEGRLVEAPERRLFAAVQEMQATLEPLLAVPDYEQALRVLATLREDVDGFFDSVMVMADDVDLQRNRIALLRLLNGLFMQVADISRLQ